MVSVGVRGSYNEDNYEDAKAELELWLDKNPKWKRVGDTYAVYWNSPMMPGFLKKAEVHIEIGRKG